jgi:hypothetical protein
VKGDALRIGTQGRVIASAASTVHSGRQPTCTTPARFLVQLSLEGRLAIDERYPEGELAGEEIADTEMSATKNCGSAAVSTAQCKVGFAWLVMVWSPDLSA